MLESNSANWVNWWYCILWCLHQWVRLCRSLLRVRHAATLFPSPEVALGISFDPRHHLWCGNVGDIVQNIREKSFLIMFFDFLNMFMCSFHRPVMHHNVRYNCRVIFLNKYDFTIKHLHYCSMYHYDNNFCIWQKDTVNPS